MGAADGPEPFSIWPESFSIWTERFSVWPEPFSVWCSGCNPEPFSFRHPGSLCRPGPWPSQGPAVLSAATTTTTIIIVRACHRGPGAGSKGSSTPGVPGSGVRVRQSAGAAADSRVVSVNGGRCCNNSICICYIIVVVADRTRVGSLGCLLVCMLF